MATIRTRLGFKIFLSYLVVILVGVVVLAVSVSLVLPGAFDRHMAGMGGMMGMMGGDHGMDNLFQGFRAGVYEALLLAALAASAAAVVAGLFITRQIIAPIRALSQASRRIAAGRYNERVKLTAENPNDVDELDQLAQDFNHMAENLEQTEALRRQLIGDVSHELRTPLTAIKGSLEALIDGVLPAEPETFEHIYQEADRLQRLVNDLQELSQVEAGAFKLNLQPHLLSDLLKTAKIRLDRQYAEKGVRLEINVPVDLPEIMADADRLSQVLFNLVGNALQYTPAGGQVTVAARRLGDEVLVSVQDTGIGIAAEHLPYVFNRFYRADRSRARVSGGSGIGLTIAKHLVDTHGGRIWVESPGEGQGSTFTFTLPVAKSRANL
jgi:signal transduction histidine kinase